MGLTHPMGQTEYPPRCTLSPGTSALLAEAHGLTGLSYEQIGALCGIDGSYWRRLTIGQRCPSRPVAQRIIQVLDLGHEAADRLLSEAVVGKGRYGR